MIGRETRMLLRHYLEQGASKSALARQLGHQPRHDSPVDSSGRSRSGSRDDAGAVWAAAAGADEARRLQSRSSRRDSRRIPQLSAVRLLDEIRAAGYDGRLYAAESVRPAGPPDAGAGAGDPLRDARRPPGAGGLRALSVSRGACATRCWWCSATRGLLWCRFYPRQDMRTLVDGLEEAFRYFGGVPQELLFDQMKAVITRDLRLRGRRARAQCGVSPLCASLGLHAARVSPLSRADQGQSRAPGPLSARTISSTVARSSTTLISISSDGSGSTTSPTCGCMGRRASVRATGFSATSILYDTS